MDPSIRNRIVNTVDDTAPIDAITANALSAWSNLFPNGKWDTKLESKGQPDAHEYAWTGIIGMVSSEQSYSTLAHRAYQSDTRRRPVHRRGTRKEGSVRRSRV